MGEENIAEQTGRAIKDRIHAGAQKFINNQPLVIIISLDNSKNIWTSILTGKPGFLTAIDERNVRIHLTSIATNKLDPFWENIHNHTKVGMLFIEPATRRRLRVNGTVSIFGKHIQVAVEQSYSNCPKYIQRREIEVTEMNTPMDSSKNSGTTLADALRNWIKNADIFFVSSANNKDELDASHRGGSPGFIEILDGNTLKIPDYQGNSMYNSLGNFVSNPKAGLLFVDFQGGKTLQLIGDVEIIWEENGVKGLTWETRRFWKLIISGWIQIDSLNGICSR